MHQKALKFPFWTSFVLSFLTERGKLDCYPILQARGYRLYVLPLSRGTDAISMVIITPILQIWNWGSEW